MMTQSFIHDKKVVRVGHDGDEGEGGEVMVVGSYPPPPRPCYLNYQKHVI